MPPLPPPNLADEVERVRPVLDRVQCALLRADVVDGALRIAGTVTSEADRDQVEHLAATVPAELAVTVGVTVARRSLCAPLAVIAPLRAANGDDRPLTLAVRGADDTVKAGQELVLDIRGPGFPTHLQVDYYTLDGGVVHLLPNPLEPTSALEAGGERRLGERGSGGRFWSVGPPFGQELVVVIAGVAPLFPTLRPEAEPAAAYLPELRKALEDAAKGSPPPVAAAVFVTTAGP